VYDFSYRLAPEYAFPTAYNDGEDAVLWVLDQIEPGTQVVLSGSSAGGNMAMCIAPNSDKVRDRVVGIIGLYPADMATRAEDRIPPKKGPDPVVLTPDIMKLFNEW
jgi:acetyl esterase/lipase